MQVDTREVIKVMIDGGNKLCDYATEQWLSGKYSDSDPDLAATMRKENLQRWAEIRRRIGELGKELRELHPRKKLD